MIQCYSQAADYLGKKTNRPLTGRASRIIRRDDSTIAIRYQATDVVTYHADGRIVLQSGGWQTVTTKARFQEYTQARVYSIKGVWFVRMGDWEQPASLYYDGMEVTPDGLPVAPRFPTKTDNEVKRKLDKLVTAYVKGFAEDITTNGLKNPSNGDCFGCLFQVTGEKAPTQGAYRMEGRASMHGRTEPMGLDHYLQHFEELYYVPSLLANAITAAGYRDPGFIWQMIAGRKDGAFAARILRGYFKNMKPALLKEMK